MTGGGWGERPSFQQRGPYAPRPQWGQPPPPKKKPLSVAAGIAIGVGALFSCGIISAAAKHCGPSTSSPETSASTSDEPIDGQDGYVYFNVTDDPTSTVPVFATKDAADDKRYGESTLVNAGARIHRVGGSFLYAEFFITDGPHKGVHGWTIRELLHKTPLQRATSPLPRVTTPARSSPATATPHVGVLMCGDGSVSDCPCAGSHRGCCSHHGGVRGCQ